MSDEISPPPDPGRAEPRKSSLPVVGMVGGGYLARMTEQAAIGLGISFRVLASDAGAVAAASCEVVTSEQDRVPPERIGALRAVREFGVRADGGDGAGGAGRLVVLTARSPKGQGASYPVAAMTRGEGGVTEILAPAPGVDEDLVVGAQRLGLAIAAELDVRGLLAIELMRDGGSGGSGRSGGSGGSGRSGGSGGSGGLVISDLVLGPHDAGLWTIDAARTSQFEQLLRAVIDLPLGATMLTGPSAATVTIVGGDDEDLYGRLVHVMAADPGVRVHLYATPAAGRRIGHVTVADDDHRRARSRAWLAANYIGPGIDEPTEF